MRQILFRAKKDLAPYSWIYGVPVFGQSSKVLDEIQTEDNPEYCTEIDEKTLGQFTGLLDKDGNRIFEGDIIEPTYSYNDGLLRVVEWKGFQWTMRAIGEDVPEYEEDLRVWVYACRVIGNIHDNPELLNH